MIVRYPGRRHGTSPQNIGQYGGALDILNHQRQHGGQLRLAQGVGQCACPMDVIDGRVGVLVVGQVDILHGQQGQFVGSVRISSMFHVPGNLEQL